MIREGEIKNALAFYVFRQRILKCCLRLLFDFFLKFFEHFFGIWKIKLFSFL